MLAMAANSRAEYGYVPLPDAVFWSDEIPHWLSNDEDDIIRALLHFRTTLIIGQPDEDLRAIWEAAMNAFPEWIGFSNSRISPNSELAEFYKQQSAEAVAEFLKSIGEER